MITKFFSRAKNGDGQSFRQTFVRLTVILSVACGVLFGLVALSGPRLRQVEVDTQKVTQQNNQRLVVHVNQPLNKLSNGQVSIEPAVAFGVANNANTITLTFKQKLDYYTTYRIRIQGATAQYGTRKKSDLNYSFKTADPAVFYLRRAGSFTRDGQAEDHIFRSTLHGQAEKPVYSARRIQSFALVGNRLAVVTADIDGKSSLTLVELSSGTASGVPLPARGVIDLLQASDNGTSYGFRFTDDQQGAASAYQNNLFLHNTTAGHRLVSLNGIGGAPLQVSNWRFAHDGTSIVAQTYDTNLVLIDTTFKHQPAVLGGFKGMANFSYDGKQLVVRRQADFAVLDVPRRQTITAPQWGVMNWGQGALFEMQFLSDQPGKIMHIRQSTTESESGTIAIEQEPGQNRRVVFSYDSSQRSLLGYRTTDNDQYVSIQDADHSDKYDMYPTDGQPLDSQTLIVATSTGKIFKTIKGTGVVIK